MVEPLARRIATTLPERLREPLRELWLNFRRRRGRVLGYSALGEEAVTSKLLVRLGVTVDVAVDIAACDGVSKSNTLALYERGWSRLAVEGDSARFARLAKSYSELGRVALARFWVTPENVCEILAAAGTPHDFGFLNLDLDSYDYFVLDAILAAYRPKLVCAEINEKIPPPLRFTVIYAPDHVWQLDHFYGQSLAKLNELCERHHYALVDLQYNNAFLVPAEAGLTGREPEELYRTGYLEKTDRLDLFPWNADMEPLLHLPVEQQLAFVREKFAAYEGRYELDA